MTIYKVTKTLSETTGVSTFALGTLFEGDVSFNDRLTIYRDGQDIFVNAELRTFEILSKGTFLKIDSTFYQVVQRELISEMVNIYYLAEEQIVT